MDRPAERDRPVRETNRPAIENEIAIREWCRQFAGGLSGGQSCVLRRVVADDYAWSILYELILRRAGVRRLPLGELTDADLEWRIWEATRQQLPGQYSRHVLQCLWLLLREWTA